MERFVCIHGHFYQPPRENPWLEQIELQDSAYPHHDWNERITAECYAPNAASRILNGDGRIRAITNNYSRISYNFGPTLLSWMEQHAPDVYAAILQADRDSQQRFSGHGSAIAQAYNHMILPLANHRDKVTQVIWGIRDFEHRFGRKPEGMWLAETAVDVATLEVLAEQGIRFTILSPYQAARIRKRGGRKWYDVMGGHVDPKTPYEQELPSGRRISLFFYDGPVSQAIAFERLLVRGEDLAGRLLGAFTDDPKQPQLVHIATDGESYGHHHSHGDMALAYALEHIDQVAEVNLTNYGEFLELFPRTPKVEILENTAWSCAHGVDRWRGDCGCNSGGHPDWNQQWRGPLRDALDWLRDALAVKFEQAGSALLEDPWQARDDYISVLLDRSPENVATFLTAHAGRELQPDEIVTALKLLEMQRHAMLMYTSCGWFFDELSGIETVQVIQYAGRAVQLAEQLFDEQIEEPFLERLALARSNIPEHSDGRTIYDKWVKHTRVDLAKVTSHYAASTLFEQYGDETQIYCYHIARRDEEPFEAGPAKLVLGHCEVSSALTRESAAFDFACVHMGDHNLVGGVCPHQDNEHFELVKTDLRESFGRINFADMIRHLDQHFGTSTFSLATLFREEQRKIVGEVLRSYLERAQGAYQQQYEQQMMLAAFLGDLGISVPPAFRMTAQVVLNSDLRKALSRSEPDVSSIRSLVEQAQIWQVQLDEAGLDYELSQTVERLSLDVRDEQDKLAAVDKLLAVLDVVDVVPFEINLFRAQNIVYELLGTVPAESPPAPWIERLRGAAGRLSICTEAGP